MRLVAPMVVVALTEPDAPFVTLAAAKAHLRVDYTDEDDRILGLIWAAQAELEGPDGWLGRALALRNYEARLAGFPSWGDIDLLPPLLIDDTHPLTVSYLDGDGATQTLDASVYAIVGSGSRATARLALAYNQSWPTARCQPASVLVNFWAGYAANDNAAAAIQSAMLLRVQAIFDGDPDGKRMAASNALLSPFRVF